MFSFLFFFFIIPFLALFIILSSLGIIFISIIFFIVCFFSILIFSGTFYWIFLGLLMASIVSLIVKGSDCIFKKRENRKIFGFVLIIFVIIMVIFFMNSHFVYTQITTTDNKTGEKHVIQQTLIN